MLLLLKVKLITTVRSIKTTRSNQAKVI